MATVDGLEPGSSKPIGTRIELERLGINITRNASCSTPTPKNAGCRHYPCPILRLLRAKGYPSPEYVAWQNVESSGAMKQDAELCSDYMDTKHNTPASHGVFEILGFGGHVTIKMVESIPDPKDKEKRRRIRRLVPFEVPAFPRPGVSKEGLAFSIELRKDIQERRRLRLLEERAGLPSADETDTEAAQDMADLGLEPENPDAEDAEVEALMDGPDDLSGEEELEDLAEDEPEAIQAISVRSKNRQAKVAKRRKGATTEA